MDTAHSVASWLDANVNYNYVFWFVLVPIVFWDMGKQVGKSQNGIVQWIWNEIKTFSPKFIMLVTGLVWIFVAGEVAMYVFLFLMLIKVGMLSEDKRRARER